MTTKKLKTTKRSERKKSPTRAGKNRGVRRNVASCKTNGPSYLDRGTGGLSAAYRDFLSSQNVVDLSSEIAVLRAQLKMLVEGLSRLTEITGASEEALAGEDPDECLTILNKLFDCLEKPAALVNATAATLAKLIRTFVTAELASNAVPAARAQAYLEYVLHRYHGAVRAIIDSETAEKVDDLFAKSMGKDADYLKDIIRDFETRRA